MPKVIYPSDNYRPALGLGIRVCPTCQVPTHPYEEGFTEKLKSKWDLSYTAESFVLASPKMRDVLDGLLVKDIDYFPLPSGFFVMRPRKSIYLDCSSANLRPSKFCTTCGRHNALHGGHERLKILKGQRAVEEMDFLRTLPEFGDVGQLGFTILVGDTLVAELKAAKVNGLGYYDVALPEE